jgi:FkbM family methyltransferase
MPLPKQRINEIRSEIRAEIKALTKALETDLTRDRGAKNGQLWDLQKMLGTVNRYFSDAGQDMILDRYVFRGTENGVFVELGINDGYSGSSCMFFEKMRNWTGIGIDAHPEFIDYARRFRNCTVIEAVVADRVMETQFMEVGRSTNWNMMSGIVDSLPAITKKMRAEEKLEMVDRTVTTQTLPDILREQNISKIDYLAMDIEGPERDILAAFPFSEFEITAISVENQNKDDSISKILYNNGFVLLDYLGLDELYVRDDVEVMTE